MPTTRTRKPRTTRTRRDTDESFQELSDRTAGAEALDPAAEGLATERAGAIRSKVSGLSVDTIVENAAKFNLQVGRTMNDLTEQCVAKAQELKNLQEAITIETTELERLYDIDIASASVQNLIDEHSARKESLETEMQALRNAWVEEQTGHEKTIRIRNDELTASRKKEADEYNYKTLQARAQDKDGYDRKVALQQRDFDDRQATFERKLLEHNNKLDAEANEIEGLRTRVANIETEINSAVTKSEKILSNVLTKDHKHELELLTKDHNAAINLANAKAANLEVANKTLAERNLQLEAQVKAAHEKIAETAKEALQSASGQSALTALKESISNTNGSGARSGKA